MHVVNKIREESEAINFFLRNRQWHRKLGPSFYQNPSTEGRTDNRPLLSTSSCWLSWCSGVPMRKGLKVLCVHHPRFTSRSFTRDWLRLRTVIHGFSHFKLYLWYTVHCRVCTSRLRGWLLPCCGSLPPFLLRKAVSFPHSHKSFSLSPNIFCGEACLPGRLVLYNFYP